MRLPAEWERQSGVMLTWPDETTPWYELEKVQECYGRIISAILRFEKVLLVTANIEAATVRLNEIGVDTSKIQFQECPINDTWARDHGGIAVYGDNGEKYLYDFVFNGWGLKFASNFDNGITKRIFFDSAFAEEVMCVDMRPFVLEGGSIDTDGAGTLMATSECLCSDNRNEYLTQEEIEGELKQAFGLKRVLWVDSGSLSGDLDYRMLATWQKGWGTYNQMYPSPRRNASLMAEATYRFAKSGWQVTAAAAMDKGSLLGDNFGLQLTVVKKGVFK